MLKTQPKQKNLKDLKKPTQIDPPLVSKKHSEL